MDFEKENKYLPHNLRVMVSRPNRVLKENDMFFLRMFEGNTRLALLNNYHASEIATGYVQDLHMSNLMSGLAPKLLNKLANKIIGTVYFEGTESNKALFNEALPEEYFTKALTKTCYIALKTGRGVLVADVVDNKVVLNTYSNFRSHIEKNAYGKITDVRLFTDTASFKAFQTYVVVEHRYYKGTQPYKMYEIERVDWERESSLDSKRVKIDPGKLSRDVLERYETISFYKEIALPFKDLGVCLWDNTISNSKFMYVDVPESQFMDVGDMLTEYDTSRTFKEVEKNLGRSRVLVAGFMNQNGRVGANGVAASNPMDFTFMQPYESMSLDKSVPQPVQFDIRTEQWRNEISGLIGDICCAVGLSILDYDPRLLGGGNRTDDEISALGDITASTVNEKRTINTYAVNELVADISYAIGIEPMKIRWSLKSVMNESRVIASVIQKVDAGLISKKNAIKEINPDLSNEQIEEELALIENDASQSANIEEL